MSETAGRLPGIADRRRSARGVLPFLRGRRRRVAAIAAAAMVSGLAEAAVLLVVVRVALLLAEDSRRGGVQLLGLELGVGAALGVAGGLLLLSLAMNATNAVVTARLATGTTQEWRDRLMAAYLEAGWGSQSREEPARANQVISNYSARVGGATTTFSGGLTAALSFLAMLVSALAVSPLASAVVLLAVVVLGLLFVPLTRLTKGRSTEQRQASLAYAAQLLSVVRLSREVRVFGAGGAVAAQVRAQTREVSRSGYRTALLLRLTPALYRSLVLGTLLAALGVVSLLATSEVGELGAVILLLVRALTYGQAVNSTFQSLGEASPYLDTVRDFEAGYAAAREATGSATLGPVTRLELSGVDFAYDGAPVLHGVSLLLEAGDTVGVVGPSGSGKSTLVQLLLRLRHPGAGEVTVNGAPALSWDVESWARQVTFVPQDNVVIPGTVAENIRFWRTGCTDEQVRDAARRAHLEEDVLALPLGYDTLLGPTAADLSGGQRQRLGLARALLGDPSVLILDEPTSALDMRSEVLVQKTLAELSGTMILVVVAHRVSTLSICDRVVVLEAGRVTAAGDPAAVAAGNAFFSDAVRLSRLPT